ncbi:MAG: glycosyltransferase family 4 protein [Candidatus Omnitrophota bacterium]
MKIVRIIARLNIGGPARNAVLLSESIGDTVLVCGTVAEAEGDMMYLASEKGVKPIIVEELGRELSFRGDLAAFRKIYGILRRERPDIVHTHTAKAGTLGRLAALTYNATRGPGRARGQRCRMVHTFHGHVFIGYFSRLRTLFFIWIERALALFTDKIITVSPGLKKELADKFRIAPENKISVIELGFELEDLLRLPLKENAGVVNVGIVGRLVPIKNHKMFLRVVSRLAACPLRFKVVIVGDGEMRGDLVRYASELGIGGMVEFMGWVTDLKMIYEDLDIVVLTSFNEGTPVSLIEAMAAGRPVVATKAGGVPDIVREGESGYLLDSGDEPGFAGRLSELIRDPSKRKAFGSFGRELVRSRFSKERLIKDTGRLYNNLLSEKEGNR